MKTRRQYDERAGRLRRIEGGSGIEVVEKLAIRTTRMSMGAKMSRRVSQIENQVIVKTEVCSKTFLALNTWMLQNGCSDTGGLVSAAAYCNIMLESVEVF